MKAEFDEVVDQLADRVIAEVDRRVANAEQAEFDDWNARLEANLSKEVEELRERRDALKAELTQLQRAVDDHPDVALVVAMVSGEITHVVKHWYGQIEVMSFDQWMAGDSDLRAVVVMPVKQRTGMKYVLKYEGSRYGDGSGPRTPLTFCRSEEEAHQVVISHFLRAVGLWAGEVPKSSRDTVPTADSGIWKSYAATGVALPWPDDLLVAINDARQKGVEVKVAQARAHLNIQLREQDDLETFAPPVPEGVS